jgi:hypothetical protein
MTRSSRIINAALGVASHVVGCTAAVAVVGFMTARGCWSEIRSAWARRSADTYQPDEPEQPTIALVVIDTGEPAQNDRMWN